MRRFYIIPMESSESSCSIVSGYSQFSHDSVLVTGLESCWDFVDVFSDEIEVRFNIISISLVLGTAKHRVQGATGCHRQGKINISQSYLYFITFQLVPAIIKFALWFFFTQFIWFELTKPIFIITPLHPGIDRASQKTLTMLVGVVALTRHNMALITECHKHGQSPLTMIVHIAVIYHIHW